MKSRVPILIVIACLVLAFIAYEVHTVVTALNRGNQASTSTPAPAPGGGATVPNVPGQGVPMVQPAAGGGIANPDKPTVSYPELCIGLVQIDGDEKIKLTPAQKKKIVTMLEELEQYSQAVHKTEAALMESLTEPQKAYIQANRQKLMEASVTPGKPPIPFALSHFKGEPGKQDKK